MEVHNPHYKTNWKNHKFLRRTVTVTRNGEKALKKVRAKHFYIKEINEQANEDDDFPNELTKHRYLQKKMLNCVTSIQLTSFIRVYQIDDLKCVRSLKEFETTETDLGYMETRTEDIIQCVKRLPKSLQVLDLSIEELKIQKGHIRKIYRSLACLRNLKEYSRSLNFFENGENSVAKEYEYINRYLSKLPKLKEFEYDPGFDGQRGFQEVLKKGIGCHCLTDYTLCLVGEMLPNYDEYEDHLRAETSEEEDNAAGGGSEGSDDEDWESEEGGPIELNDEDDSDDSDFILGDHVGDENDDVISDGSEGSDRGNAEGPKLPTEEEKTQIMTAEVSPFYRFYLFPNLKSLTLELDNCLYPLGSFVAEGFNYLKKLEQLRIIAHERPHGTKFLFEGMTRLPTLKVISLMLPFIADEEWGLLGQFFKKQSELVSISINIFSRRNSPKSYFKQNGNLGNISDFLTEKPKLQYLTLKSKWCPLESLSKILMRTSSTNLRLLDIEAFDDTINCTTDNNTRVEGLCDFIARQKDSLYYLKLSLPFVLEAEVLDHVARAIGELTALRQLNVHVNDISYFSRKEIFSYLNTILQKDVPENEQKKLQSPEKWDPSISDMLKGSTKLENLIMHFGLIDKDKPAKWLRAIFKHLPNIKTLRDLAFSIPASTLLTKAEPTIIQSLKDLENINTITVAIHKFALVEEVKPIEQVALEVNQRQSLRGDLMF